LVDKLLVDLQSGGSSDALPLLSFTMEQLFLEYGGSGKLTLADYVRFGGIKGAITAAVRRALALAERDPAIVKDASERLRLLRRGIIPLLAGIDPETGLPRRRIAKLKDIPAEAASLVLLLRDNKLLSTDRAVVHEDGRDRYETTIEPAHEALLRQWDDLRSWLEEDRVLLTAIEVVKRAAKDWFDNGCSEDWLDHTGSRLDYAERAIAREDLVPDFPPYARDYVVACRARDERDEREERERLARERAEQERRAKDAEALAAAEAKRATAAKKAADANRRMFMAAVAGLVVVAALGALAYRQWQNASSNLAAARDIFSSLVNTAEVVQRTASLDTVEALIKPVHQTIDKHSVNGDPVIELERAQTLLILAENDWEGANLPAMQQQAAAAVGYLQPLADAGDLEAMNQLARGHRLIGRAYLEEEKDAAAKGEYDKAVAALTTLLDRHKTDANAWRWWRSLADVTEDMGDLLLQHHVGEIDDAAKYYNQSYDIRVRLTKAGHNDPGFYADVAWAINKQGDLDQARGAHGVGDHKTIELNKAAERFKEARQALEDLREALYDSPFWQHRLALMDNNIGLIDVMNGDFSGAVAEYERAERVLQPVIEQDPKNIYRSSALAWTYDNKGYAMVKQVATADGDHLMQLQSARALFQQAAERRKKIHDEAPTKKQWESDLDKTEANIAATQAMIDRLSQKDREAAEGFERAVRFLKAADEKSTNMDLVARDIEYLHDAGVERGKADDGNGARSDFAQAAQMLRDYGSKLEPADLDKLQRLLADDPHLTGEN
jgi:tetratricopeptide (TPR) repeat protein